MESKLLACQEEMSRHAPLYSAGVEALSMKELETLSRIHEEGLRQIIPFSLHSLSHNHGLYPAQMAVGMPPSLIPNCVAIHSNGHANGAVGPWFNHSYMPRVMAFFLFFLKLLLALSGRFSILIG